MRDLAKKVAQELTRSQPDLVLWQMTKAIRGGKVFLDWSQNTRTKTTISPYSLRGTAAPYVAAPRSWEEIEEGAEKPDALHQCDMHEVLERVADDGDLFADLLGGE